MPFGTNLFSRYTFFSNEKVEELTRKGMTVDGTVGGLVLGRSHDEGGIPVLHRYADGYRLCSEFEGYEYFANPAFTQQYGFMLEDTNKYEGDRSIPFIIPDDISEYMLLDCRSDNPVYGSKYLITDARAAQFVVNAHSTVENLNFLDTFNRDCKGHFYGPLAEWRE